MFFRQVRIYSGLFQVCPISPCYGGQFRLLPEFFSLTDLFSEEVAGIDLDIEQLFDVHLCGNAFCSARH